MSRLPIPLDDPVAAKYIAWCEQERIPDNTVRRRRTVLRAVGNPSTATRAEIETWWAARTRLDDGRPRADSSRANELAVLRSFYRWCQVWEYRDDNPTVRLSPPKVPNSVPRPASRKQLDRILAALHDRPPLRRAVCLGAYAGLRISEAAALDWRDVNLELRRVTVLGKGRKRRVVPIGVALVEQLLAADPDTDGDADEATNDAAEAGTAEDIGERSHPVGNVVTGTDTAYSADALRRRVDRALARAGVAHDITFHQLRHRFGTIAYQSSGDLVAVRDLMGHASIATTSGYAAANDAVADRIAAAVTE